MREKFTGNLNFLVKRQLDGRTSSFKLSVNDSVHPLVPCTQHTLTRLARFARASQIYVRIYSVDESRRSENITNQQTQTTMSAQNKRANASQLLMHSDSTSQFATKHKEKYKRQMDMALVAAAVRLKKQHEIRSFEPRRCDLRRIRLPFQSPQMKNIILNWMMCFANKRETLSFATG